MVPQELEYAFGLFPLVVMWLGVVLSLPNRRYEIITLSVIGGLGSILTAFVWTQDWWHPPTVTDTAIGLEDFFLGVTMMGIFAGVYELLGRQRTVTWTSNGFDLENTLKILGSLLLIPIIYSLGFHSVIAWNVGASVLIVIMYWEKPWLLKDGIVAGVTGILVGLIWFAWMSQVINPQFFQEWYYTGHLTGITILGGPLEDYIWAFQAGLISGPAWEYLRDVKS